jgi:hypothetical protein
VLAGFARLRDNTTYDLADALQSTKIFPKIDVYAWIANRYIEFSIIYKLTKLKKPFVSTNPKEDSAGIKNDIAVLASENNWMKVAKRIYSLAKRKPLKEVLSTLQDKVFNSDLGRLYSVLSDAETLQAMIEDGVTSEDRKRIQIEVDGFRSRLAFVTLPEFLKPVEPDLKTLIPKIHAVLQPAVKDILLQAKLYPLPSTL